MLNNLNLKFVKQNCQLKHKYFVYNYKFHLTMTSHLRRFSAAASTFSQHIHRNANCDVRNVLVSL